MIDVQTIVPFDGQTPKTRLADVLGLDERRQFARAMLRDVLTVVEDVGSTPVVLSRTPLDVGGVAVCVDDRPLSTAVNEKLRESTQSSAVVMSDLPLLTTRALRRLLERDGDIVLARGTKGGTNALVTRHPAFSVDYHGGSYDKHLRIAREVGASVSEVDSYRLGVDIDEPDDLVELLLHGDGYAVDWLRDHGFETTRSDGEPTLQRSETPPVRSAF